MRAPVGTSLDTPSVSITTTRGEHHFITDSMIRGSTARFTTTPGATTLGIHTPGISRATIRIIVRMATMADTTGVTEASGATGTTPATTPTISRISFMIEHTVDANPVTTGPAVFEPVCLEQGHTAMLPRRCQAAADTGQRATQAAQQETQALHATGPRKALLVKLLLHRRDAREARAHNVREQVQGAALRRPEVNPVRHRARLAAVAQPSEETAAILRLHRRRLPPDRIRRRLPPPEGAVREPVPAVQAAAADHPGENGETNFLLKMKA